MKTMTLKEVQVVAEAGTEFGVLPHTKDGLLTIICRRKGEPWPYGMTPDPGTVNTILPPGRRYSVEPTTDRVEEITFKP